MNHPESDSTMSESRADEMFGAIPIEWDGEKNFETETWRVRAKLLHAETKALETALAAANEALKRAEAANDFNEREIEKTREALVSYKESFRNAEAARIREVENGDRLAFYITDFPDATTLYTQRREVIKLHREVVAKRPTPTAEPGGEG